VRPNRRANLQSGLGELWILQVKHDIAVQQLVRLAAGHERQDDVTMRRARLCEDRASSNGLPSRSE
jgi:hypothetical protein